MGSAFSGLNKHLSVTGVTGGRDVRTQNELRHEVPMPILIMALVALAVFGVIGIMLFAAESAERRQAKESREISNLPKAVR
jgi:hypothetical protein